MRRVLRFLFRKRASVKPIAPYIGSADGGFGWVLTQGNTITEFLDDWKRAGFRVAVWNARWLWEHER